jgi:hypothetical protein
MVEIVGGLTSIAIFFAIVYAFAKAALAPIHEKLDRILTLQEMSRPSKGPDNSVGAGR